MRETWIRWLLSVAVLSGAIGFMGSAIPASAASTDATVSLGMTGKDVLLWRATNAVQASTNVVFRLNGQVVKEATLTGMGAVGLATYECTPADRGQAWVATAEVAGVEVSRTASTWSEYCQPQIVIGSLNLGFDGRRPYIDYAAMSNVARPVVVNFLMNGEVFKSFTLTQYQDQVAAVYPCTPADTLKPFDADIVAEGVEFSNTAMASEWGIECADKATSVKVKAVSKSSKLRVDVNPNKGNGYWTFQVQRRLADGTWQPLKTYKTKGSKETRTLNLKKGTYRVVVKAKYGYQGTTSAEVYLKK